MKIVQKNAVTNKKAEEIETSSEGLTLKELPNQLNYAFLEQERAKQVIISAALT